MRSTTSQFIFFLSVVMFISCSNSKQNADKNKRTITSHQITTNKKAINNSVTDSSLLAPDFSLPSMNGDKFTLSEHRGEVIVLNLWATWCSPCVKEIPDFIELQNDFKDKNVQFVGVSLDVKGWDAVRPFAKKHNMNYRILLDRNRSITKKYQPQGIPNTFIINKRGEVAHYIIGMTSKKLLRPLLQKLAKR